MKIADINPHIRFAEEITYASKNRNVYAKDCRLFYIIGGSGEIFINNSKLFLKKNTLFYCCGGMDYIINTEEHLHLYSLNFDLSQNNRKIIMPFIPQDFCKTSKHSPVEVYNIKDSHFLNSFFILNNGLEFKNSISSIVDEFSSQRMYFRENCGTMLKKLLIDLHKNNYKNQASSADAINITIDYINSNFTKEITNSELAELAGYHEYYLNRLFIKHTGISMHKYILNLRINEGKYLLLNTKLSISDIASQIGFNSNTHFSTYFKKETGLSPFEYRNSFKNNI